MGKYFQFIAGFLFFSDPLIRPCLGEILISEIGSEDSAGIVELYNPTDEPVDLTAEGYRLEVDKTSIASTDPAIFCLFTAAEGIFKTDGVIEPFGYSLICGKDAASYISRADLVVTNRTSQRGLLASGIPSISERDLSPVPMMSI